MQSGDSAGGEGTDHANRTSGCGSGSGLAVVAQDVQDGGNAVRVDLPVPAQVIDGVTYVPARGLFDACSDPYAWGKFVYFWNAVDRTSTQATSDDQTLSFEFGQMMRTFRAGDNGYAMNGGYQEDDGFTFPGDTRILYGELMVAVCGPGRDTVADNWFNVTYDPDTKTLTVPIAAPQVVGS